MTMTFPTNLVLIFLTLVSGGAAWADGRVRPVPSELTEVDVLQIIHTPSRPGHVSTTRSAAAKGRGICPPEVVAHTDSNFGPGQYILQAGFEQNESAAISFEMPAEAFPVRLDLAEILFGTSGAIVQTTTEWSILVFSGTPDAGTLVAQFSSDGTILPHLVMPPGTNGTIIQFAIDPADPEQIIIPDDGSQTITVAFRVDALNTPGNPCLSPPPENRNAFPATDVSGLAVPAGNWLDLVPGTFCLCGTGWASFQQLPGFCQPSGDWVMRATVTPFECSPAEGACCRENGLCEVLTEAQCGVLNGSYQGNDTPCLDDTCPLPLGACCQPATEICIESEQAPCEAFGGTWRSGEDCDDIVCFERGACCLPDGSCQDNLLIEDCLAQQGSFRGDQTACVEQDCPQPEGWCCTDSGEDCFQLNQVVCDAFGGVWGGFKTQCSDEDACIVPVPCPADLDRDGAVAVNDLLIVLAKYGSTTGEGDVNGDEVCDVNDLLDVISVWGPC